jgi:predicted esterase
METDGRRGKPPIFLSHGVSDPVLPVGFTRQLAETLREEGHTVRYEEFGGEHVLPRTLGRLGFEWFMN